MNTIDMTVPELKKECKLLNIKVTNSDGRPKLKQELINSLKNSQSGGRKRRSRKASKRRGSRRVSRKSSKKCSKCDKSPANCRCSRKTSKRRSRKTSKRRSRRGSRKKSTRCRRGSRRGSRKVSRRRGSKKKSTRRRRSHKQIGGSTFRPISAIKKMVGWGQYVPIGYEDVSKMPFNMVINSYINKYDSTQKYTDILYQLNLQMIRTITILTLDYNDDFDYYQIDIGEILWKYSKYFNKLLKNVHTILKTFNPPTTQPVIATPPTQPDVTAPLSVGAKVVAQGATVVAGAQGADAQVVAGAQEQVGGAGGNSGGDAEAGGWD